MARNVVQFQKGLSEPEFERRYGTEEQCRAIVIASLCPKGFECLICGATQYSLVTTRGLYQCAKCRRQTSPIAGTIFASGPSLAWLGRQSLSHRRRDVVPADRACVRTVKSTVLAAWPSWSKDNKVAARFMAGMLSIEKCLQYMYKYFEARIKISNAPGTRPALWLLALERPGDEIDVMEILGATRHDSI
jgi:hypothetical protein